jgi:maltose alpha-D-glucosyltransferase/alpha-amylase
VTRAELTAWIDVALPGQLASFLPAQRWFAGKARPIAAVEIEDAVWLPGSRRPVALVVVRVRDTLDACASYALIVAFDTEAGAQPMVGRVDGAVPAWAVEAATSPDAALALLEGFTAADNRDVAMLRGGVLQYRDAGQPAARVIQAAPDVRPIGADQSNTSLCVGRWLAFKLVRRLAGGINPELEVGRFLATRGGFGDSPHLRGSITYVSANGQAAMLGILQDWVESQGDGWSHMVELARRHVDDAASNELTADAYTLGVVTERLHRALASGAGHPAFEPEPITRGDVERWKRSIAERAVRVKADVARDQEAWPAPTRRLARAFLERHRDLASLVGVPDPHRFPFMKIRVHGDFHLGQTLKTAGGFVIVDFEGEPARPLVERRARQPALKDVAGMLRSFDYAVHAATGGAAAAAPLADRLRRCYLDGYRAAFVKGPPAFVPANPAAMSAWIEFFELDKALYETEYEINNRPGWVHIPLRGLVRLAGGLPYLKER